MMEVSKKFTYRVNFTKEILVNREQEYIRKSKKSDYEYESEFEDTDFENAKRWIKDCTISFYAKDEQELKDKIRFEFHNARIDTEPLVEDEYFYWFDNNCLVEQERMLHRGKINVDYACYVEMNIDDLLAIANGVA